MNGTVGYQPENQKTIEKQKQTIQGLETTNEKLRRRVHYYENFLENIAQFEKTQNVPKFKEFIAANVKTFENLVEELYQAKEEKVLEYINAYDAQRKTEETGALVERENVPEGATKTEKPTVNRSAPTEHQIKVLQKQADFLTKEVDELNEKNKRYVGTLSKKDFFHEYEMLLKEVQGLRKQNAIVNEKLKTKVQEQP